MDHSSPLTQDHQKAFNEKRSDSQGLILRGQYAEWMGIHATTDHAREQWLKSAARRYDEAKEAMKYEGSRT